jgi:glycosyltransferase involved in cell wall biosynthesis
MNSRSCGDASSCSSSRVRPRLALIGPITPPFRGGISHYTAELRRALAMRCDLQTVSFHRLYPPWLYPGRSDRDPGFEHARAPNVRYALDALNPLTWRAVAHEIAAAECDLVVINWWTLFWAPGLAFIARRLRARDIPVVFICHNLVDHDSGSFEASVAIRLLAQAADAYLVHSTSLADRLHSLIPGKHVIFHPHPPYGRFPEATVTLPKCGRLELLFFGFVRPYKGLDVLIESLTRLRDDGVYLTIAGEPWRAPGYLQKPLHAGLKSNVEMHLRYVSEQEAATFFRRADLVVLPYRSATGSGVAALAQRYDCPILATKAIGLPCMFDDDLAGFLVDADNADMLADRIRRMDRNQLTEMRKHIHSMKPRHTWESLADALIELAVRDRCTLLPQVH